ncbi:MULTISPECIES: 2-hydroxyacid dehydrogenase [unclassified Chelatococcus]|uniref:2-hydroxyacid dehydrogenase n=1 Tax=unclassified Chelatococcus TaxID=2638111 RepID=UPI001BCD8C25|nr:MULTISPECIES: 2-hydroxyacid dehydrogenase [unclassified Chelatococcus]MBS7696082.1 2-hydroxyacid dehydrogenase [Chelatococcus sp. YT9]MBX3558065.1 2-hydroxyacid dehydrogenase [Chelatococcus sp.]
MTAPLQPIVAKSLSGRFTVHNLWEAADKDALLADLAGRVRGVVAGSAVDAALIDKLPALEIISSFGVGYDKIDAAHAAKKGVLVTNTPDVLSDEVADLALGLLLSTVRQLPQADRYLRAGHWLEKAYPLTATLAGRKVGILGLGRIGKAIAKRCEAFNLPVAYHGRRPQADVPYQYFDSLVGLAKAVDILIVVIPGGSETDKIVNAEVLAALGPTGILINVARGTVIDEKALIKALADGTIQSAGLDVFEKEPHVPAELIAMDHVVLLPHVGSATHYTRDAMGQLVVDNIVSWFAGKGPVTPVVETPWPRKG